MHLEKLKEQRILMEGNVEVCAILDKQIFDLESKMNNINPNNDIDKIIVGLENKLTRKIAEHKNKSIKLKEAYARAKADLEKYGDQLRSELEASLNEINLLKNELNSLKLNNTNLNRVSLRFPENMVNARPGENKDSLIEDLSEFITVINRLQSQAHNK